MARRRSSTETSVARRWRLDLRSMGVGMLLAAPLVLIQPAGAFDLGGLTKSISSLANIKKNLDNDVKNLTSDAKTLIGDKDKLLQIKDQLLKLANDTKMQIDSISALVGVVESHLKKTQADIERTAKHVGEIDAVRKSLGGK